VADASSTQMSEIALVRHEHDMASNMLKDAEARLARYATQPHMADLIPRAEALRDDAAATVERSSARLLELENTAHADGALGTLEQHRRELDHLRYEWADRRNAYAAKLEAEGVYSREGQEQLLAEWEKAQVDELEARAAEAWKAYERSEQAMGQAIVAATNENAARYDLPNLGTLITDYTSQLEAPPGAQGWTTNAHNQLQYVAALLDRVEAGGNPNEMRAARIAAGPVVRRLMGSSDSDADTLSRDLNRRLAGMSTAELGRIPDLERNRAALAQRGKVLRGTILELEKVATGKTAGIFGTTPWQARILREDMQSRGGGVVDLGQK
jgi:hypothetical protein